MYASVRALLTGIIDYAGLFPPAKLPLAEALGNYLRYRKESPYAWMLGRFVCPTARLQELLPLATAHPHLSLLSLTALGTQGSQASDFVPRIELDLQAIGAFRRAWGTDAVVDMYEVALPKGVATAQSLPHMPRAVSALVGNRLRGYFEIPIGAAWRDDVANLSKYLSCATGPMSPGLKLRCGGVTADAFPSNDQVAFFVCRCQEAIVSCKATAGLHHPRRHWDATLNLWHHGFFNVFGAGLLAWTNSLTEADLVAILADREAHHFHFDEAGFGWKTWRCTTAQIVAGRTAFATSFGCCSFTEPVEDLLALGLLDWA